MKSNKTRPTINKVSLSINQLESEQKRKDSQVVIDLMSKITN